MRHTLPKAVNDFMWLPHLSRSQFRQKPFSNILTSGDRNCANIEPVVVVLEYLHICIYIYTYIAFSLIRLFVIF